LAKFQLSQQYQLIGFAAFTVDPGSHRGGVTTITATYYDVVGPEGQLAPFETFMLRPRAAISAGARLAAGGCDRWELSCPEGSEQDGPVARMVSSGRREEHQRAHLDAFPRRCAEG
jgi:hypothetical protein